MVWVGLYFIYRKSFGQAYSICVQVRYSPKLKKNSAHGISKLLTYTQTNGVSGWLQSYLYHSLNYSLYIYIYLNMNMNIFINFYIFFLILILFIFFNINLLYDGTYFNIYKYKSDKKWQKRDKGVKKIKNSVRGQKLIRMERVQ